MDYPVKTDSLYVCKTIFEETSEQTVDADFALPDYCPDIQKILKCQIEPHIESKNIIGDRIEIDGISIVRIIYIDSIKTSVRCTEQSYPFSITSNLKDTPQFAVIQTDIKVNYLNCRALSPRRLNIHGAFNVGIKVIDRCEQQTCTNIIGDDVQQKKLSVDYSYLQGIAQQQFAIAETLETGQNHPAIQSVIRSDIRAVCSDCKPIANKIMYKGDLLIKLMYLSDLDSGKVETMEYTIPFSQVIDINGATEKSLCAVRTEILNYTVALKSEIGFDDPVPVLTAKLCVTAFAYEERDTTVITDCYSTKYFIEPTSSSCSLPMLRSNIKENIIDKATVDFTDTSLSRVIDVWCEKGNVVCNAADDKAVINGKYNICVLAVDTSGNVIYTERSTEYKHPLQTQLNNMPIKSFVLPECISVGFRFSSEKRVEVRTELLVTGELYEMTSVNGINCAKADDSKPRRRDDSSSLVLYFADEGEDVWDIARDYCTSVSQVRQENDLSEDVLPCKKMLMIPV
ncbi:MAG: DUF3794 domain-containing protein [Lachnospiraceae bacterium]|nr:DUF3794 domain-containing protein [Lachnospiraceae bacterium]